MNIEPDLFSPYEMGRTKLRNRLVMSPMGRRRAHESGTPSELMAEYYGQRASAGLVITESTHPALHGKGQPGSPHLFSEADKRSWAKVVSAVHDAGGTVFVQLMHSGSAGHHSVNGGRQPLAPSPVRPRETTKVDGEVVEYPVPREMAVEDIRRVIAEYTASAALAIDAGFDGVELHVGNGFLPQQFLASGSNRRTDEFGGSPRNRCRFVLDLVRALSGTIGAERVGFKISPGFSVNQVEEIDALETYTHLLRHPDMAGLAYCHTSAFSDAAMLGWIADNWRGTWIHNVGINPTVSAQAVRDKLLAALNRGADLVSVGRVFIANPDLVERLEHDWPLAIPEESSFYGGGAAGYTDYPASRHLIAK
ncbi:alkene reductase [Amycolatopsis taiwanensis]|nr:alkene reductase [Amycolatopsis taiwanensis]